MSTAFRARIAPAVPGSSLVPLTELVEGLARDADGTSIYRVVVEVLVELSGRSDVPVFVSIDGCEAAILDDDESASGYAQAAALRERSMPDAVAQIVGRSAAPFPAVQLPQDARQAGRSLALSHLLWLWGFEGVTTAYLRKRERGFAIRKSDAEALFGAARPAQVLQLVPQPSQAQADLAARVSGQVAFWPNGQRVDTGEREANLLRLLSDYEDRISLGTKSEVALRELGDLQRLAPNTVNSKLTVARKLRSELQQARASEGR